MKQYLGETRSAYRTHHAFISPDSHELTTLPNWSETMLAIVIAPPMGAGFTEYFAEMSAGATGRPPLAGVERFFMVLDGCVTLRLDNMVHEMVREGYAIIPADTPHTITATVGSKLVVLEKEYEPLNGFAVPEAVIGRTSDHIPVAMKGDERLQLQKLAPEDERFDFEINIMEFTPGTGLPYVETHYMEHGLLLLNGGGVYRLEDHWYPAAAGDIIWMGPYCPQWFAAIGRENSRYLIYKNYNRDPLSRGRN